MRFRDLQNYWRFRPYLSNAWAASTARRGGENGELVSLQLKPSGSFFVRRRTPDMRVFNDIFVKDVYGLRETERQARGEDPPFDTVVDVGGNIGLFAIRVAPLARRVVVCEPMPENVALLQRNIEAAGRSNVEFIPCAVTAEVREVRIYTSANPAGHSALRSLADTEREFETVPGRSLQEIFESHHVDRCDFLKIDCEGGEYEILLQADAALLGRVDRIAMEYHNAVADDPSYTGAELERRLTDARFHVRRFPSRRHENYGLMHAWRA